MSDVEPPEVVGERIRREVLGDEYVDARRTDDPFLAALQEFVTASCWGTTWARPGLERRTRSIVTISVLAALGRSREIGTHTLGALNNGVTPAELAEIYLHVGTYAGVPAALEAFRAAAPVVSSVLPDAAHSES